MDEPSPDSHQYDFANPSHTSVFIKDDFVIVNVVIEPGITNEFKFKPDDKLKEDWLNELFPNKSDIFAVFDDRNKVVDMWRRNGLTCFQVADGNF